MSMSHRPRSSKPRTRSISPDESSATATAAASPERLQKLLARLGYGSRREIEGWISGGRLSIDGKPASLGQRVLGLHRVALDGRPLRAARATEPPRVLIYHKPSGQISSRRDPEGRDSVFQHLPRLRQGRWVAVGRLDLSTQGLLLFTTDGELAHRLMHPATQVEREYAVRVRGQVGEETLARLREGVLLDGERAAFQSLVDAGGEGSNHWYHVVLQEGRNREVRRLWESVGVQVSRLIRVRYGCVSLPRALRSTRLQELQPPAVAALYDLAGLPRPPRADRPARRPVRPRR